MKLSREALLKFCPQLEECFHSPHGIWLAYSGGCDSHALLHLVVTLLEPLGELHRLHVIHIDHNVQSDSAGWAQHCRNVCGKYGVELIVETLPEGQLVDIQKETGSIENVARDARYSLFTRYLGANETLLLAHHADDQMETMLYRLMRGSGPAGLSGMPQTRSLGKGILLRLLLGFEQCDVANYALQERLEWVEDPSNEHTRHDRNFLRHDVLPLIKARWPGASKSWMRSSRLLQDAERAQSDLAKLDLAQASVEKPYCLDISALLSLEEYRQRNLIRFWLMQLCRQRQWREPDYISLVRIVREVIPASPSASPLVRWPKGNPQCEIRRYDGRLYFLPTLPSVPETIHWSGLQTLNLGERLGTLQLIKVTTNGFSLPEGQSLEVRFKVQGLKIKESGRRTRSFSKICQQLRIPVWVRDRMPLVYRQNQLVSVAGLITPCEQSLDTGKNLYRISWVKADLD